jgi:hypothetical protein
VDTNRRERTTHCVWPVGLQYIVGLRGPNPRPKTKSYLDMQRMHTCPTHFCIAALAEPQAFDHFFVPAPLITRICCACHHSCRTVIHATLMCRHGSITTGTLARTMVALRCILLTSWMLRLAHFSPAWCGSSCHKTSYLPQTPGPCLCYNTSKSQCAFAAKFDFDHTVSCHFVLLPIHMTIAGGSQSDNHMPGQHAAPKT